MKKAVITIALAAAITSCFVVSSHSEDLQPPVDQEAVKATMAEMRKMALTGDRKEFGIEAPGKPTIPWGVVMEMGFPDGFVTVVALSDGTASVYFSNGGGYIGGDARKPISDAAQAVVTLAADFQSKATETKDFPAPKDGQTTFYLRTDAGVFTASGSEEDLVEERHDWSPLFHAAQKIITEYRKFEKDK